jgi:hypothetical protein
MRMGKGPFSRPQGKGCYPDVTTMYGFVFSEFIINFKKGGIAALKK